MSSSLGRVWFSGATAGLARLGRPGGAETRRRPCTVRAGDGCEVGRCGGEVSIALVSVLAVTLLAVTRAVACAYGKWLRVGCLIGWPGLSGCIQGTCGSGSVCFLRDGAVVQSSRISISFTASIGS